MSLGKNSVVVAIYGIGGHKEQMYRLMNGVLQERKPNSDIVVITDDNIKPCWAKLLFSIDELRSKTNSKKFFNIHGILKTLKIFFEIKSKYNNILVISTGPGHAIIFSYLVKIFGGEVVHVETWSRFYSKSITGKLMYYISDKFYIQNIELKEIYRKAIYSGRL